MCINLVRGLAAILPAESANCMQSSAGCNTAGRTQIKFKNVGNIFLHIFTICEPYI